MVMGFACLCKRNGHVPAYPVNFNRGRDSDGAAPASLVLFVLVYDIAALEDSWECSKGSDLARSVQIVQSSIEL